MKHLWTKEQGRLLCQSNRPYVVRVVGFEPTRCKALEPKGDVTLVKVSNCGLDILCSIVFLIWTAGFIRHCHQNHLCLHQWVEVATQGILPGRDR